MILDEDMTQNLRKELNELNEKNGEENDMATTANNWKTPGTSNPGRYNTPPLTRDLVPRS